MTLILVIEDDTTLRDLIVEALSLTHTVISAEDGRIGLELARQHLPELIISDIAMPALDGIAMLQHLRADEPVDREMPAIMGFAA